MNNANKPPGTHMPSFGSAAYSDVSPEWVAVYGVSGGGEHQDKERRGGKRSPCHENHLRCGLWFQSGGGTKAGTPR